MEISAGMKDNKLIGYTFKVMTNGYGGDIEITVGINMDGKVEGVQIGQHSRDAWFRRKNNRENFY